MHLTLISHHKLYLLASAPLVNHGSGFFFFSSCRYLYVCFFFFLSSFFTLLSPRLHAMP